MPGSRNLYDVLNVAPEAEPVVLEAAYKALIKKYHPDQAFEAHVSKDAAEINEAFALLKDPARRADYDHRLWTKQQAIRLAELQAAARARRPRFAALGGWVLAGVLACALAAVAVGKSVPPSPLTPVARAAETGDSEAPVRAAAARAAAAEAVHDQIIPSSATVIARVHAQQGVSRPKPPVLSYRSPAPAPARYRRLKPARPKAKARQADDFLEKQGYIY